MNAAALLMLSPVLAAVCAVLICFLHLEWQIRLIASLIIISVACLTMAVLALTFKYILEGHIPVRVV